MSKDYLTIIEDYLQQLNVTYQKKITARGDVSYSFDNFSTGFVNIIVVIEGNKPTGFSIRGLHNEIIELAHLAEQTKSLLNVPILNFFILDGDKMSPQIVAVIQN